MFGCGIGYGLDSMFGFLEVLLNYVNWVNKVSMYVNLGFKFWFFVDNCYYVFYLS